MFHLVSDKSAWCVCVSVHHSSFNAGITPLLRFFALPRPTTCSFFAALWLVMCNNSTLPRLGPE